MQKNGKHILIALAAASLTAISGCSWFGGESASPDLTLVTDTVFCKGIVICGVDMEGKSREEALQLLQNSQQEPEPFSITLTMDDDTYSFTQDDFTIDYDYTAAVEKAYTFLYGGTARQYYIKKFFLETESRAFGASQSVNAESLEKKLTALAKKLSKDPVEPTVLSHNGKKFTFSDGEDGVTVNTKKLIEDVTEALKTSRDVTVAIEYEVTKPKQDPSELAGVMEKLGSFSTVSTNTEDANTNMALALSYVNGTVVSPGETFSFNKVVGNSTSGSRGFVKASVIVNGKVEQDYGGGVCQASTTLYGAVTRSNLTIVERSPHTWPSTYVPIGQDAAISYGSLDFQFRNDTEYPVYIESGMEGTVLTATIYGYQSDEYDEIEVTSEQTGTLDIPAPTFTLDESLGKGEVETDRSARAGQTATAKQIFYKDGEVVKTQDLPSSYYPSIGAVYRYGPGTDLSGYQ